MILALHILIALGGIVAATINVIKPSRTAFRTTVGLTAGTIGSGVVLTIMNPAHLLQTCISGLAYTTIVIGLTALAQKRATN